jgi:hypothetical protein
LRAAIEALKKDPANEALGLEVEAAHAKALLKRGKAENTRRKHAIGDLFNQTT